MNMSLPSREGRGIYFLHIFHVPHIIGFRELGLMNVPGEGVDMDPPLALLPFPRSPVVKGSLSCGFCLVADRTLSNQELVDYNSNEGMTLSFWISRFSLRLRFGGSGEAAVVWLFLIS